MDFFFPHHKVLYATLILYVSRNFLVTQSGAQLRYKLHKLYLFDMSNCTKVSNRSTYSTFRNDYIYDIKRQIYPSTTKCFGDWIRIKLYQFYNNWTGRFCYYNLLLHSQVNTAQLKPLNWHFWIYHREFLVFNWIINSMIVYIIFDWHSFSLRENYGNEKQRKGSKKKKKREIFSMIFTSESYPINYLIKPITFVCLWEAYKKNAYTQQATMIP